MNMTRQSLMYGAATLLVLLLTILLDMFYFVEVKQDAELKEVKPKQQAYVAINEPQVYQMAFVDIELPPPPSSKVEQVRRSSPLSLNAPKTHENTDDTAEMEQIASIDIDANAIFQATKRREVKVNSAQISERLRQLSSLKGVDRSLQFPSSSTKQILEYMHSCIGIDVGAVKQNHLTVISHKNRQHSQIVRLASGYKTPQEQALMALYAPQQTLVRLYPRSFDEVLGRAIARHLGQKPLTQLSGEYVLKGNDLWLTKLSVNKIAVLDEWQLTSGC